MPRARVTINERMATFVLKVWGRSPAGYTFVAARDPANSRWYEVTVEYGRRKSGLRKFFQQFAAEDYDLYFCPNNFALPKRLQQHAQATALAWCDIDEGKPRNFIPSPSILWRTSPRRHQGLWLLDRLEKPEKAEAYSKALAIHGGGDRNGWSVTKMLRIPWSINHKPEYQKPTVTIVDCNWRPIADRPTIERRSIGKSHPRNISLRPDLHSLKVVWHRYRSDLHPRTSVLINSKKAYKFERDRSKCIYEIIVGLHRAGATPDEIGAVLWNNPYFISKHGRNLDRLCAEVSRVLAKLEVRNAK